MKGVEVFDHARTGWSAVSVEQNMLMRMGEHFRSAVKCNTDGFFFFFFFFVCYPPIFQD